MILMMIIWIIMTWKSMTRMKLSKDRKKVNNTTPISKMMRNRNKKSNIKKRK